MRASSLVNSLFSTLCDAGFWVRINNDSSDVVKKARDVMIKRLNHGVHFSLQEKQHISSMSDFWAFVKRSEGLSSADREELKKHAGVFDKVWVRDNATFLDGGVEAEKRNPFTFLLNTDPAMVDRFGAMVFARAATQGLPFLATLRTPSFDDVLWVLSAMGFPGKKGLCVLSAQPSLPSTKTEDNEWNLPTERPSAPCLDPVMATYFIARSYPLGGATARGVGRSLAHIYKVVKLEFTNRKCGYIQAPTPFFFYALIHRGSLKVNDVSLLSDILVMRLLIGSPHESSLEISSLLPLFALRDGGCDAYLDGMIEGTPFTRATVEAAAIKATSPLLKEGGVEPIALFMLRSTENAAIVVEYCPQKDHRPDVALVSDILSQKDKEEATCGCIIVDLRAVCEALGTYWRELTPTEACIHAIAALRMACAGVPFVTPHVLMSHEAIGVMRSCGFINFKKTPLNKQLIPNRVYAQGLSNQENGWSTFADSYGPEGCANFSLNFGYVYQGADQPIQADLPHPVPVPSRVEANSKWWKAPIGLKGGPRAAVIMLQTDKSHSFLTLKPEVYG